MWPDQLAVPLNPQGLSGPGQEGGEEQEAAQQTRPGPQGHGCIRRWARKA